MNKTNYLTDERLSLKAKAILAIAEAQPKSKNLKVDAFADNSTDSVTSVRSGLKELERYGYLYRYTDRDEEGRIIEWVMEFSYDRKD